MNMHIAQYAPLVHNLLSCNSLMNGKKERGKKTHLSWRAAGPICACDACEGGCNGVAGVPTKGGVVADRGGAGCSGDGRLCRGGGDVVGVAAATRLGTTGSVSCVGDGAVQWQIRLRAASDVVVGEQGWPSCARREETAVML